MHEPAGRGNRACGADGGASGPVPAGSRCEPLRADRPGRRGALPQADGGHEGVPRRARRLDPPVPVGGARARRPRAAHAGAGARPPRAAHIRIWPIPITPGCARECSATVRCSCPSSRSCSRRTRRRLASSPAGHFTIYLTLPNYVNNLKRIGFTDDDFVERRERPARRRHRRVGRRSRHSPASAGTFRRRRRPRVRAGADVPRDCSSSPASNSGARSRRHSRLELNVFSINTMSKSRSDPRPISS